MLRANRRVLKPGGKVGFWTIHPSPGLSRSARRIANIVGPPHCAMRSTHQSMLVSAGFIDIEYVDATADYLQTLNAWLAACAAREPEVRAVIGDADLDREIADHLESVRVIEDGLLKRSIYVATKRPGLSH